MKVRFSLMIQTGILVALTSCLSSNTSIFDYNGVSGMGNGLTFYASIYEYYFTYPNDLHVTEIAPENVQIRHSNPTINSKMDVYTFPNEAACVSEETEMMLFMKGWSKFLTPDNKFIGYTKETTSENGFLNNYIFFGKHYENEFGEKVFQKIHLDWTQENDESENSFRFLIDHFNANDPAYCGEFTGFSGSSIQ